jgi:translation elongation factor EF-Tu-like GTPase
MGRLLFTIEDVFLITGRGVILVPGFKGEEAVRMGQEVLIKRPDGSEVRSTISGMDIPRGGQKNWGVAILVKGLSKEDVPVGSTVWTMEDMPSGEATS